MNKPPFMEELEKKLRVEECIFKFRTAELTGNSFKLELLVDHNLYDHFLTDELKNKVIKSSKEIIPDSFDLTVRFVKASNEENTVIKNLMEFIYTEKPTLYNGFSEAPISYEILNDVIYLRVTLEKYLYEYAVNSGLKSDLEDYLSRLVMEDVEVEFIEIPNDTSDFKIKSRQFSRSKALRTINVDIKKYYSGTIAQHPRYLIDVADKEVAQVCVCGVLSNINSRYIEKIDKVLFSFQINDTTGTIKVKYFARQIKNVNWEEVFIDGETLVMEGQIKFDKFDSSFAFFPRNIAKCAIDYSTINLKSEFLPEPESYSKIFPKKISAGEQYSLIRQQGNPDLENNVFVVFDVETTGIDATTDKIIELSAVKLVNGEITESFDCLVDPKRELPPKIIEITHITDDMVRGQYIISEVIGDFYKFTRGAILVAHNASFDMGFLSIAGRESNYNFDNTYMDTLAMARQKLKRRNNKLDSLCTYFHIPLVGAHRALNDAVATAKLFIELMNL